MFNHTTPSASQLEENARGKNRRDNLYRDSVILLKNISPQETHAYFLAIQIMYIKPFVSVRFGKK